MWYNATAVEIENGTVAVPVKGRIQRARVRVKADGTRFALTHAYMPTRRGRLTEQQAALQAAARDALHRAAASAHADGLAHVVAWDLQAQATELREGNEHDAWLAGYMMERGARERR